MTGILSKCLEKETKGSGSPVDVIQQHSNFLVICHSLFYNILNHYNEHKRGSPMKIERFTDKAREAISEAAEIAKQHNNSQIEVEHLLDALLKQEGGVVQQIIQKAGGDVAAAQRIVAEALER